MVILDRLGLWYTFYSALDANLQNATYGSYWGYITANQNIVVVLQHHVLSNKQTPK